MEYIRLSIKVIFLIQKIRATIYTQKPNRTLLIDFIGSVKYFFPKYMRIVRLRDNFCRAHSYFLIRHYKARELGSTFIYHIISCFRRTDTGRSNKGEEAVYTLLGQV